jgi:hypothetical protein
MFVFVALLVAVYVGVDLNEARDAQQIFDKTSSYDIHLASTDYEYTPARSHHRHLKNVH